MMSAAEYYLAHADEHPDADLSESGGRLRFACGLASYTPAALAEAAGVSERTVRRGNRGGSLYPRTWMALAEALNVKLHPLGVHVAMAWLMDGGNAAHE